MSLVNKENTVEIYDNLRIGHDNFDLPTWYTIVICRCDGRVVPETSVKFQLFGKKTDKTFYIVIMTTR